MNVRNNAAALEGKAEAQRYVEDWKNIRAQTMRRIEQVLMKVEKRAAPV